MYSILCSPDYWKELEQTVLTQDSQILYKSIGLDIDIFSELEKIARLPISYLIIDLLSLDCDEDRLIQSITRYRIASDKTQIIIIATGLLQGNSLLHKLVTLCSVYDIIDISEGDPLLPRILQTITNPTTYKRAVKWIINDYEQEFTTTTNTSNIGKNSKLSKGDIKERTITVLKEKIVGTVTISIVGADRKIGVTHTSISIATYLKGLGNEVGIIEMNNNNDFDIIQKSYEGTGNKEVFTLNGIKFFKGGSDLLEVLNEELNYLILDMGTYNNMNYDEFLRSNVKIILSGVKDWETPYLEEIIKNDNVINKYKYLFNFSDEFLFKGIKENMDSLKCYMNEYNPNPFTITNTKLYNELLNEVLISTTNKKQAIKPSVLNSIKKTLPFFNRDK